MDCTLGERENVRESVGNEQNAYRSNDLQRDDDDDGVRDRCLSVGSSQACEYDYLFLWFRRHLPMLCRRPRP